MSVFSNYIHNDSNKINTTKLVQNWNNRIKISSNELTYKAKKAMKEVKVIYNEDLAKYYRGKFVNSSDLLRDRNIKIIKKNQSVILICDHNSVGAVIRNAALKSVSNHFDAKIKVTVEAHHPLNRENEHASSGVMIGHGFRENHTS